MPWYSQCASDFIRTPILFIGTQLNEPLLKYHIERYKILNPEPQGVSYLIARSATPIQIQALKKYKIEFIPGTLSDFSHWLSAAIPEPKSPFDIAMQNIPQLRSAKESSDPERIATLLKDVIQIKRDDFKGKEPDNSNTIKSFYKGFKPSWSDITNSIPAELNALSELKSRIESLAEINKTKLLPILGPAGSGKTTLLMQACWHFCKLKDWEVFYIDSPPESLLEILLTLETSSQSKKIVVAIDNIEFSIDQLEKSLKSEKLQKTLLIGAERESSWNRRGKHILKEYIEHPIFVRDFTHDDAIKILEKLRTYGSWTRLGKMSQTQRVKELLHRSKKQLLIALLESTLGKGFEDIIDDEYSRIESIDERVFLAIIALATDRRCTAPINLVDRALEKLSILKKSNHFKEDLAGIVHQRGDDLIARHPVYAKQLIERSIDPSISAKSINAMLQAFSDYKAPVIKNCPKPQITLYKGLINHRFLFEVMKGNQDRIINTYKDLEKKFESDGLFWLQYGLALRDFDENNEALEKLRIAAEAYPMAHTYHALAHQLLLCAVNSDSPSKAISLADEAKEILNDLDDIIDSDDTYPIITLAEGYTAVLIKHTSENEARSSAKRYAMLLQQKHKENPEHELLKSAYEKMLRYSTTGKWRSSYSKKNQG